jgi:DNA polymerase-1
MGPESIAAQSVIHVDRARELLRLHRETYRKFWSWAEANVDRALLGLPLESVFGWRIHYPPGCNAAINDRSILNWPMQSHGAEMMRLAVSMAIEDGLLICAPIHDALLLEAPIDEIDEQAGRLARIMGDASEIVMGAGFRCRSDVKIIRYPDRFEDEARGGLMFNRVMKLLEDAEVDGGG